MKRIFCDTEFTDFKSAKLISIALVTEDGDEFYSELSDTYENKDLSIFAKENVIPLLNGGKYRMSWNETQLKMREWVSVQGNSIIVIDSLQYDWPWILSLFDQSLPDNLDKFPLILSFNYLKNYYLFEQVLNKQLAKLRQHHARDDAFANLVAWKESGKDTLT